MRQFKSETPRAAAGRLPVHAQPAAAGGRKPSGPEAARAAVLAELRPGQSVALLQALHILTRDGLMNQDSRRKLKQVYHLYQFIDPLLQELAQGGHAPLLADHGAGKSYLGFILYDLYFKALGRGEVIGIEWRGELVRRSRELARELGFARMRFLDMAVAEAAQADLPERFDIITALHACDTATDDAIDFGLAKRARFMVLVPCCQAEVAANLRRNKAFNLSRTPLAELWRHPIHTREMGSQITNVLRCLRLEASGYQVTVTELVGWEHSLKNELIIARHTGHPKRSAQQRLQAILDEFGLRESLGARFGCPLQ